MFQSILYLPALASTALTCGANTSMKAPTATAPGANPET